jgi:hypothetical protein
VQSDCHEHVYSPQTFPDPKATGRIMKEVLAALASIPTVRAVGVFGSFASDTTDRWSDIDMLVGCEHLSTTQWLAADAIRSTKPVLYYRKFTNGEQPSGKYWFEDESPFHRIDISFHTLSDYQNYLGSQVRDGHDMTLREIYSSDPLAEPTTVRSDTRLPLIIDPTEQDAGLWIARLADRSKACIRGRRPVEDLVSASDNLRRVLASLPSEISIAGGDIHSLAQRLLDISQQLI